MIKGGGCVFTNGRVILAGYQPHKKIPVITGLGGKRNENEDPIETAWRETIEELFEIENIPEEILKICIEMKPENTIERNGYIQFIYNFGVLERILQECYIKGIQTSVYKQFPFTIQELLLERIEDEKAEIETLALVPIKNQTIAKHFIKDIQIIRGDEKCQILRIESDESD